MMIMKRIIFFILLTIFILCSCSSCFAVQSGDISGLSLEECLNIALENHPSLKRTKGATRAAEASLEKIKSSNRVKVAVSGTVRRNGDYKDWETGSNYGGLSLTASKVLYDTNVNKLNREIQTKNLENAREDETLTQVSVAATAKRAYYDLVLRILNRDVQREKLHNLEEHLKTAKGIYDVGNSSFIDVTKAEADVAGARVSVLQAENDVAVSQESLRVAMGVSDYDIFNLFLSTKLFLPQPSDNLEQLLSTALTDRADYRKILNSIEKDKLQIKASARGNAVTVKGNLSNTFSKNERTNSTTEYVASVTVDVPVEDGGETKANVEIARAQLDQDMAEEESLRQSIQSKVRSASLSLANAIERVKSSEMTVKHSEENLSLAEGRYEVGVGDALEVSDAVSTLASSRYTLYQALYDAQVARSDLDEALGHLPIELQQ